MTIPGILFLNKTYGRKDNCYLYKFKPYNKDISIYYVPYKIPNIGFSKVFYDLYVLANQENIEYVLGPTNNLEAYYKYQLHCHKLILSQMPLLKTNMIENIKSKIISFKCEDRTTYKVFTIDGATTTDFDDAFSIQGDIISVYISDVYHVLQCENLWDLLTEYVSNIYMPNERIPMVCNSITEICSLKVNKESLALTMDYNFITDDYKFRIAKIKPYRNFIYEEDDLKIDENYQTILKYILSKKKEEDTNSEKVVEYLMRLMCFKAGETLYKKQLGIFRTINELLEEYLPSNKYILYNEVFQAPYVHITSPIRRLVDVLNSIALISSLEINDIIDNTIDISAINFYKMWESKLDYINTMSKSIRRVQNESMFLYLYNNIKDINHNGMVLSTETYEKEGIYFHTIFLDSIHLIAQFQSTEKIEGSHIFKIFKFDKEANFKKKIKLGLVILEK